MSGPPVADLLQAAAVGDLVDGVLIPLSQQGKVRVTYEWLYSASTATQPTIQTSSGP